MNRFVDIVALVMVLYYLWRGLARGALLSALGIAGVFLAYLGAHLFSPAAGATLQRATDLPRVASSVLAGAALFFLIYAMIGWLTRALWRRRLRHRVQTGRSGLSARGRLVGALLSGLAGVVTLMVLCWTYSLVRSTPLGGRLPDVSASFAMRMARALAEPVIYGTARVAGSNRARARTLSRTIAAPDQTVAELYSLMDAPGVQALLTSKAFSEAVLSGSVERIEGNAELQGLLADLPAMERIHEMGLVPDDYAEPAFRERLYAKLAVLGSRLAVLLEDPETQEVVEALRKEGLLEWRQLVRLLFDRRFLRLLDQVFAPVPEAPGPGGVAPTGSPEPADAPPELSPEPPPGQVREAE